MNFPGSWVSQRLPRSVERWPLTHIETIMWAYVVVQTQMRVQMLWELQAHFTPVIIPCPKSEILACKSLMILNKHSTSSVEAARGCSGVFWVRRTYSWLSMLVVRAITVSQVNPSTAPVGLYVYNVHKHLMDPCPAVYYMHVHVHIGHLVMYTLPHMYLFTSIKERSYCSVCHGISSSNIMLSSYRQRWSWLRPRSS